MKVTVHKTLIAFAAALVCRQLSADPVMDANWINLLYSETVHRSPTPQELATTETELTMGTTRDMIALDILQSQEFDTITVQEAYQLYLHRPADSAGLNAFVPQLQMGTRDESVFSSLISSSEYFMNRASNDNAMFVNAIYNDVLNRTPSSMEVTNAVTAIQNTSRATYTNSVLTSSEARGVFVNDWFHDYLNRSANTGEQNTFVSAIAGGATFDQVRSDILGSQEFYDRAQLIPEAQTTWLLAIGALLVVNSASRRTKSR